MAKTKKTQQSPEFSRRVATYSALASAAMLASPAADAALHVWDVGSAVDDTGFVLTATGFPVASNFQIGFAAYADTNPNTEAYFWGPQANLSFINSYENTNDPDRLPSGVQIGLAMPASLTEGQSWYQAETLRADGANYKVVHSWNDGEQGYMGIRFANGADYNYGWVDITNNADDTFTINRWALEDTPDTPALTGGGAVPEPGTGALLALLAMGATGLRRRRQSAAV